MHSLRWSRQAVPLAESVNKAKDRCKRSFGVRREAKIVLEEASPLSFWLWTVLIHPNRLKTAIPKTLRLGHGF